MKDLVVTAVTDTLNALKAAGTLRLDNGVPAFAVEPPKQAAHGDFAVNIAMVLQKSEGKPPRAIAEARDQLSTWLDQLEAQSPL